MDCNHQGDENNDTGDLGDTAHGGHHASTLKKREVSMSDSEARKIEASATEKACREPRIKKEDLEMSERELRLECLRLALKDFQGSPEKVVERAEAFSLYIVTGAKPEEFPKEPVG
ncbi:hypothetical protein [Ochrobactrum sp. AP1BH01-1]|jgi:hypothetical protein|uniref:hypothetical protein n=1 Tax=Ochrobactrum sp. AP1BH01-1 TaxID=2823874 RepID=UPI001B396790|nr:hypothetical protein [Ochrobactrum sp. AP1BH01-1]MBQ0707837.1 hypothetical protein [Ochrobactrum sp. AP1BH01-1]